MNFQEALEKAKSGKVIRRRIWEEEKIVFLIISKKNTKILTFHIKGTNHYIPYKTKYRDFVARDWEVIEKDKGEGHE